jgi:hypothetical protein
MHTQKFSYVIPSISSLKNYHITKKNTVCNSVGDYLKTFLKKSYLTKLENN